LFSVPELTDIGGKAPDVPPINERKKREGLPVVNLPGEGSQDIRLLLPSKTGQNPTKARKIEPDAA